MESVTERVRARVRDVPDFPRPGILFKDITPVIADPYLLRSAVAAMAEPFVDAHIETVAGIEARGFIFGAALALSLGAGFVPVRKPGKLPHQCRSVGYELEYGTDAVEAHVDALAGGRRVLIVDDVLATGGTAAATARLIEELGGEILGAAFLIELGSLSGRARLPAIPVHALLTY